jgi:hypothetical protein
LLRLLACGNLGIVGEAVAVFWLEFSDNRLVEP